MGSVTRRGARRVPVEGQRWPLRLHGEAGDERNHQRGDDGDGAQKFLDRQLDRPAAKEDGVRVRQVGGMAVAQREKCGEQNDEGQRREDREGSPFEAKALPEDACIAERAEPEQVNPVGDGGSAADEDENDDGEEEINHQARARRFPRIGQSMVSGIFHPTQAICPR